MSARHHMVSSKKEEEMMKTKLIDVSEVRSHCSFQIYLLPETMRSILKNDPDAANIFISNAEAFPNYAPLINAIASWIRENMPSENDALLEELQTALFPDLVERRQEWAAELLN